MTKDLYWLKSRRIMFYVNILRDGAGMINREVGYAKQFAANGADVTILSHFKVATKMKFNNIKTKNVWPTRYRRHLYDFPLFYPLTFLRLFYHFLCIRPEIVFVDLHQEAWWALLFRRFFSFKIIFTYHGVADSRFYQGQTAKALDKVRAFTHSLLPLVDKALVVSNFLQHETNKIGCAATTLYNGIEDNVLVKENQEIDSINTQPLVLFVGRYTQYKGALNIVKAFAIVVKKIPEAKLLMHGFYESQEYQQEIESFIGKNNLTDSITIRGPVEGRDVPALISNAKLFVNGSLDETFCMPLLEAQARAIPCVAFSCGGVPEVVLDGRTGLLAPENDIAGFADNIITLLKYEEKYRQFAINARNHAAQFCYSKLAEKMFAIVKPLLDNGESQ